MFGKSFRKREIGYEGDYEKYFFWAVVIVLVILSYLILKNYLIALISAFILAYLVRPLFIRIQKPFGKFGAALISIFVVLLILILPIALVLGSALQQAQVYLSGGNFENILGKISSYPLLDKFDISPEDFSGKDSIFVSFLTSAVYRAPSFLISVLISLFGMYYILVHWDGLAVRLKDFIPFKDKEEVSRDISRITNVLVYGTLFIAFIEFIVGSLGFYFLGIDSFLLLSLLIFFFAFIPALGPAVVWIPLLIYNLVVKNYFTAGGVLVVGLALSVLIDSVLKAKILGDKSKINPFVMLLGIFGGISIFGIFGFIIGPLVLAYTLEILEEVVKSRN
ncbi:AI-2E family transporter [Candidatus Pacearchaeota archaeon]|nr:AI-2E family transporter [Candidatus Pacearchaeota archaeon]